MRYILSFAAASMLACSFNAIASPPSVAVDIAPLHSLVSQVMEGIDQPSLLIPAEASPHDYTLRPSEAKALADADIVFWIGESYTPWLEKALDNISNNAKKIEMLALSDTITHDYREGATFDSHDHADEDNAHHNEEKHHKEEREHHSEEHHDDHENESHADHHDHEGHDPHAWLDPENAKIWVQYISTTLSEHDPSNASLYKKNASQSIATLDALIQSTQEKIDTLNKPKFIVFHDAYQYFETRFGISAAGSISLGDAQDPSPARIKEIRNTVKQLDVTCVFTEPQYNSGLVNAVFDSSNVSTIGVIDPLGARLTPGAGQYEQLIKGMVNSLSECK